MHNLNRFMIVAFIAAAGLSIAAFAATRMQNGEGSSVMTASGNFSVTSPGGHETIKASVLNNDPSAYRINVKKLANMDVNQEAPTFAVYIRSSIPSKCGDFRDLELPYKKPTKYEREFNLSDNPEVLEALKSHGCVVMRNIPSKG